MKLLHKYREKKVIIFFNTCHSVSFYERFLQTWIADRSQIYGKTNIYKLTGNMKQAKRLTNYTNFNEKPNGIMIATDVIARGIDFPSVDLIIQVDVPQDPSFYIHRIGRTARKGLEGHAVLLLSKNEVDYIDYMDEKKITITEFDEADVKTFKHSELNQFNSKARKLMLTDKDYIIKASKAYVSYIRSYTEHKVSSIFKMEDVDYGDIAKSYFLFKVPFVKELKGENSKIVIATEEELAKLQKLDFTNKNQSKMIDEKIENDKSKSKIFINLLVR
jgi:ATP-dependent RNA helicase DDX55/SPB4